MQSKTKNKKPKKEEKLPKDKVVTVRIDAPMRASLEAIADRENRSMSNVAQMILMRFFEADEVCELPLKLRSKEALPSRPEALPSAGEKKAQ